ncbi:MAG: glutathione S-transferase family protein [Pseudomonadales bacterium]|jgi:glutathione S-transferase|nr:glutathione S-transferase family protein [Pseudomonadales bacterium]
MELHLMPASGNCYKCVLALAQLGLACSMRELDIRDGTTREPAFLELNPNGRVPLLITEDGTPLPESNAILHYLADGSGLLPRERLAHAQVLQWMFFEQYSHEPYIATNRYFRLLSGEPEAHAQRMAENEPKGHAALRVMEQHLQRRDFFVGDYSIADIALFAYTHVADEGGYDLAPYPAVRAWIERVRGTEGFVPMAA